MNSLISVLAANASHTLEGERIDLKHFAKDKRYAALRKKPDTP